MNELNSIIELGYSIFDKHRLIKIFLLEDKKAYNLFFEKACAYDGGNYIDFDDDDIKITIPVIAIKNPKLFKEYNEAIGYIDYHSKNIKVYQKLLQKTIKEVKALETSYNITKGTEILKMLNAKKEDREGHAEYFQEELNELDKLNIVIESWNKFILDN